MDRLNYIIATLEKTLGTRSKRHIMGGTLISVSLLFTGLAITVVTLKTDEEGYNNDELQVY